MSSCIPARATMSDSLSRWSAPLLRPDQQIRGMALAMRRGPDDGSVGYERVANALAAEARAGRTAVFLTEGDPMLFGSGSIVAERLRRSPPRYRSRLSRASARSAPPRRGWAGRSPARRKSSPSARRPITPIDLGAILDRGGPVCWLKAADVLPTLVEELRRRGRLERRRSLNE